MNDDTPPGLGQRIGRHAGRCRAATAGLLLTILAVGLALLGTRAVPVLMAVFVLGLTAAMVLDDLEAGASR